MKSCLKISKEIQIQMIISTVEGRGAGGGREAVGSAGGKPSSRKRATLSSAGMQFSVGPLSFTLKLCPQDKHTIHKQSTGGGCPKIHTGMLPFRPKGIKIRPQKTIYSYLCIYSQRNSGNI